VAKPDNLDYGPVVIEDWFDDERIGNYDDDEVDEDFGYDEDDDHPENVAVVYEGHLVLSMHLGHHLIPYELLRPVTTDDLMRRREVLSGQVARAMLLPPDELATSLPERYRALIELHYVEDQLMERLMEARFGERGEQRNVFLSHSSNDKMFARWLAVDLANIGHSTWLDEWDILAGESIPSRISQGLDDCEFVVLVLSESSVASHWVEREWQAKYWDEVNSGRIHVIPALLSDCAIPTLLKTKRYADFRRSYSDGFDDLLLALKGRVARDEAV
jgi:hypothetical protein